MYDAAVTWGEVGEDVRDMACVDMQNSDTNEAEVECFTANAGGDNISRIRIIMQDNSAQAESQNVPIAAPIAVEAQIASNGNIQVLVAGFLGQVYVAEYDPSSGNLITDKVITLPFEFTGVTDVRFDPNNPGRGFASGQNSDNIVVFEF